MLTPNYQQGLSFPLKLNAEGYPEYSNTPVSVDSSVKMILSWSLNHRAFDNIFGSITSYLWLPSVQANHQALSHSLRKSLIDNDHRIDDAVINIYAEEDRVFIEALVHLIDNTNLHTKIEL